MLIYSVRETKEEVAVIRKKTHTKNQRSGKETEEAKCGVPFPQSLSAGASRASAQEEMIEYLQTE